MFLKSVIAVIVAVTVASLFGGVKSAPTAVTRDAGESLLYKTLTAQAFTLKWVMPEKATRATLSVTGDGGYSAVYADLTTTQQALELPAAPSRPDNEQIFTFTLAFDNGERFVAKLGSVCGVGDGAVAQTCGCRVVGTRLWERALSAEVVPVAAGMTDFTVALDAGVDLRLVGYNDNARLGEIPGRAFVKNSVYARKNGKVQLAFDPKIAFPNAAGNFGSFQVEVDVVGEGDPLIDRDEYVILDLVNGRSS